jgi:hypothetical protein
VLDGPGGRAAVVLGIEGSEEADRQTVRAWFARYLGHTPSTEAEDFWVGQLALNTEEGALAKLLASEEYFALAGNSNEGFVTRLHQDLLGRPPSAGELGSALEVLAVAGRSSVAFQLLTSAEYRLRTVGERYLDLLHREATASDLEFWSGQGALNQEWIDVLFKVSDEFFAAGR